MRRSPRRRFSQAPLWSQSLHGGEDYELLFTVAAHTAVPREFQGLPLTRIGTMRKGSPGTILLDGAPLPALGYDHLRSL